MKSVNVMCIEYDLEHNNKDPKFRDGNTVRISRYKISLVTLTARN